MIERSGEGGSRCLNPLEAEKNAEGPTLTNTTKVEVVIQNLI